MILITAPSTRRAKWDVTCSVHGHVGKQTDGSYCIDRAHLHQAGDACEEPIGIVEPSRIGDGWQARCLECGTIARRSSKAIAATALERHFDPHQPAMWERTTR